MRSSTVFVFAAALAVGALGSPVQGSRCDSLDFSCQDLWTAAACGTTKSCIPRWEQLQPAAQQLGNDTELCALCKQMVEEAKDQLLSNETQDELRQVLEGSCDVLVPIEPLTGICKKVMDSFMSEVVDMLVSRMDPTQVCTVSGLCWTSAERQQDMFSRVSHLAMERQDRNKQCLDCQQTVDKAKQFTKFVPQEVVIDSFIKVCEKELGTGKCTQFAHLYVAKFFQRFNSAASARTCQFLGQCPGGRPMPAPATVGLSTVGDELECEFCEAMIHKVVAQFNNTSMKTEVKTVLVNVCKHTGSWAQECLDKVEKNFDAAYDELIKMLNPTEVCTMIGFCSNSRRLQTLPLAKLVPATVPETMAMARLTHAVQDPSPRSDAACTACTFIANTIDTALQANATKATLTQMLDAACKIIPMVSNEVCSDFVARNLPVIIELFEQRYTADYICSSFIPLCPKTAASFSVLYVKKPVKTEGEVCDLCEQVATYLVQAVNDNDAKENIEAAMEKVCEVLPIDVSACQQFIDENIEKLYELLRKDVTVDAICKGLGLCKAAPSQPKPKDGQMCLMCTMVAEYLLAELKDNKTEAAIEATLDKACRVLPIDATECQNMVQTYLHLIIQYVQNDLTAQQICEELTMCSSTSYKTAAVMMSAVAAPKPKDGQVCLMCTMVTEYALAELKDNKTLAEIQQILEKACTVLPVDATECKNSIDTYMGMLIDMIEKNYTPQQICAEFGLCAASSHVKLVKKQQPKDGQACLMCTMVAEYALAELKDNKTLAEIQEILEKACTVLPVDATECKNSIDTYMGMLIDMIEKNYTPQQICAEFGLCAASLTAKVVNKPKDDGQTCILCTTVTDYVLMELKDNATDEEIYAILNKACSVLPIDAVECQNMVKTYVGIIIQMIEQQYTGKQICQAISLCPADAKRMVVPKPVKKVGDNCAFCTMIAGYVLEELKDQRTDEAIRTVLEKACSALPVDQTECQNLVDEYVDQLIKFIQENLTAEQICQELGLCATSYKPDAVKGGVCSLCKELANWVIAEVANNKTEAAVVAALDKVCSVLPVDKTECKNIVDTYAGVIINMIVQDAGADVICSIISLCSPVPKPQPPKADTCALCETVADWVLAQVKDNKTEAAIMAQLEKVCTVLPIDGQECKNMIDTYGGMFVQYIMNEATPQEICSAIRLCSFTPKPFAGIRYRQRYAGIRYAAKPRDDSQACPLCQIIVNVVEAQLQNNNTQAEIEEALEKACSLMPADDQTVCRNMVNTYTGYIINLVQSLASPEQVCQLIGFCPTPPSDTKCVICMFIANYAEEQLANQKNEAEILALLDKVCDYLPNMNVPQCKDTVNQFADMIITLLREAMPPRKVCEEIKLCPIAQAAFMSALHSAPQPNKVAAVKDEQCEFCKWLVTWVDDKLEDNRTQEVIKEELYKACDLLSDAGECRSMVNDYIDMMVKMLVQYADPEMVCEAIGKCTSKKTVQVSKGDEPPCRLCKYYVQELRARLSDPATESEIRREINQVCRVLPVDSIECTSFAQRYADELVKAILDNTDPEQVCQTLRVCPRKLMMITKAEPNGCDYCKLVMNFLSMEVNNESTDDEIIAAVEKVCAVAPAAYKEDCQRMIELGGIVIVRMLADSIDPDSICQAIKFCPAPAGGQVVCTWCEYALHFVQDKLYDNVTEHAIQAELEKMCADLPQPEWTNECKEFVDVYGPSFEVMLAQKLDPSIVCPAIHACPARRSAAPLRRRPSYARCHDCMSTLQAFRQKPAQIVCQGANAQFRDKCEVATKTVGLGLMNAFGSDYNICKLANSCTSLTGSFKCNRVGCRHVKV